MRSTLFFIPAEFMGLPVFGIGWLLGLWAVAGVLSVARLARKPGGSREIVGYLPFFLLVAALIVYLLPNVVLLGPDGQALGVPVRGFGVMLMLATVAAVGLAAFRAWQVGIDPEMIYALAFTMFIAGIIGARLFYIVQYWHHFAEFRAPGQLDWLATLKQMSQVTEGGLVVYGSVLAGVPAGIWFCRRRNLNALAIGDIIAPSMVVGLALGRIGCFLNGCCFGGVCPEASFGLTFPAGSPPYAQQEEAGWRSGIWLAEKSGRVVISYIGPHSSAASSALQRDDEIVGINGGRVASLAEARDRLGKAGPSLEIETASGDIVRLLNNQPPARSVPIHATQLYAAIDAALLAAVLWFIYPFRRRDGEVFALLVTVHPLSRILLEMIRSDEPGQFGTAFTISQWLSLAILVGAGVLWWYIERQPRRAERPDSRPTAN